jgi:NitT/TauT family transport system substrate-binding protein
MHPPLVAPGCFARIVLRGRGLDPDADIEAIPMFPGDYSEHIRLLKSGELDAAVIGSTLSPEQLAADEGLRLLLFFGTRPPATSMTATSVPTSRSTGSPSPT